MRLDIRIRPSAMDLTRAKTILKAVLPPFLTEYLRSRLRAGKGDPEWQFVGTEWPSSTDRLDDGWNQPTVSDTQRAKWTTFSELVRGSGPLGIAHEAPILSNGNSTAHNAIMTYGYVLARAAHMRSELSVLDWGGGVGHFYLFARALMPTLNLDYHCKDVQSLSTTGSALCPDVHFYSDDREVLSRSYDLVMASTSLQYSRDWRRTLHDLAQSSSPYLFVTGLPLVTVASSFVVVQRPHQYGYHTEYACWFLNRDEFLSAARNSDLVLEREFLAVSRPVVVGAPESAEYRGFLFVNSKAWT